MSTHYECMAERMHGGSAADRDHRQAGLNETVSGASMPKPPSHVP